MKINIHTKDKEFSWSRHRKWPWPGDVHLNKARKPNQPRLRFDLEKLRDPDVACTFLQAMIGGKVAPLIGLSDEDIDIDTMITTYSTAR